MNRSIKERRNGALEKSKRATAILDHASFVCANFMQQSHFSTFSRDCRFSFALCLSWIRNENNGLLFLWEICRWVYWCGRSRSHFSVSRKCCVFSEKLAGKLRLVDKEHRSLAKLTYPARHFRELYGSPSRLVRVIARLDVLVIITNVRSYDNAFFHVLDDVQCESNFKSFPWNYSCHFQYPWALFLTHCC